MSENKWKRSLPPLPESVADPSGIIHDGCYYIHFTPVPFNPVSTLTGPLEGTLRVERYKDNIIASGDLYLRQSNHSPGHLPLSPTGDKDGKGIPIFPRRDYRFYIRVTRISKNLAPDESFSLDIRFYQFDGSNCWGNEEPLSASLKRSYASDGSNFWIGEIRTNEKIIVGQLSMVWISSYFRRAVLQIDKVAGTKFPVNNGNSIDWQVIFDQVRWSLAVIKNNSNIKEPETRSWWYYSELHKKMSDLTKSKDLDTHWRYHLLVVHEVDPPALGIMYDYDDEKRNETQDFNHIPREGAAIAFSASLEDDICFENSSGKSLGSMAAPYFRTALHEVSHTMSLAHPVISTGNHIMETTKNVACNAPEEFPDNIQWSFSVEDQKKLRHLPDMVVRPGGLPFIENDAADSNYTGNETTKIKGLAFQASALIDIVPLGAPVRINFSLTNHSGNSIPVSGSLSMKSGHVSGKVVGPCGTERRFSTIVRCSGGVGLQMLPKGKSISHSMTLLRGSGGALFPSPGFYRVILELRWNRKDDRICMSSETSLMVMPPVDEAQARAALKIFSTPETLHSIAIGGDHHQEGNASMQAALEHPVLRPHFSLIEAKRLGKRFWKRKPDLKAITSLIDKSTIMSPVEIKSLAKIIKHAAEEADKKVVQTIREKLLDKAHTISSNDEILEIVQSIKT